ncbi:hypothetical protein T265_01023 [Opisthorchis viverrini]|uniref:Uncharacterized protein n=1 Tax=Opisthorchis viverrini TaxID=6198 RepID=A0A075AJ82_OPIVI|nr:hypothetical protein T265_01023 [Opisthorchis viverrini]KER32929.1 hypothetical protein T265_01023 [Opisthorchis viverrini]
MKKSRANVSLRMSLNSEISPRCDETVYKVIVCAGEFTNDEIHLFANKFGFARDSPGTQLNLSFVMFPGN